MNDFTVSSEHERQASGHITREMLYSAGFQAEWHGQNGKRKQDGLYCDVRMLRCVCLSFFDVMQKVFVVQTVVQRRVGCSRSRVVITSRSRRGGRNSSRNCPTVQTPALHDSTRPIHGLDNVDQLHPSPFTLSSHPVLRDPAYAKTSQAVF